MEKYMRIGIDARTILNPDKGDAIGIGHYTYQLIRHLLDIDGNNHYVLFFDSRVREKDIKKFTRSNTTIKFFPFSDYKKYMPGAYNEILANATMQKEKLDVLHSTSPISRIPIGYNGPCVITFHDLSSYQIPQCYSQFRRVSNKANYNLMAKKADRIIAVSESTRNDLEKFLKVPREKVRVIYSGLDKRFFETANPGNSKILERHEINKKYILFLGTLEPSKNVSRLLEAFKIFKEKIKNGNGKFNYQLVLAGKRGWLSDEYPRIAKDLGISKDVVFPGYVIGDELVPLFKSSEFFVMPSLYEGFGMTVLEAFATGTPAIISKVSSLPEIADDAAYFVDPLNVSEIADAMVKFATDENLRNEYRQKGLKQAEKFDWEKTAKETLDIYNSIK